MKEQKSELELAIDALIKQKEEITASYQTQAEATRLSMLNELDALFRERLHPDLHRYVFLSEADIQGDMARDSRGRRNALVTWAERARAVGADMIVVPQVITMQERVGGKAGVVSAAAVNEDFYLIDAREPVSLIMRCHFAEEQKPLASDITKIGTFFKRGGGWVTAKELAAEGMDKAVKEFGL